MFGTIGNVYSAPCCAANYLAYHHYWRVHESCENLVWTLQTYSLCCWTGWDAILYENSPYFDQNFKRTKV